MRVAAAVRWIKTQVAELNLFESEAAGSNPFHLRTAIISTRFYIIFLTIAVMILVVFTAFGDQIQTVTIREPSEVVFQELYSKYSTTLQCPCSRIDISYNTFVNASFALHPVCSSVFVSDLWINLLFSSQIGYFFQLDFRSSASGQFQLLASFCSFANRTLQDAIDDILSDTLLSPQALSPLSLDAQSQAQSLFLQTSTTNTFLRLLNLVRGTTQINSLQPALQTSKMHLLHVFPNNSLVAYPLETIWVIDTVDYKECFCSVTSNCSSPSGFFDLLDYETSGYFALPVSPNATVTGFVVGCYALESLLQSTLECFFNQTCLKTVLNFFPISNITSLDILDINQTHYAPETTIEELVNNLLIERWFPENSFSAYYSQCAPISCTYKFTQRNHALQVLTTLLGLYGGLTVALRFCVPLAIGLWRRRKTIHRTEPNAPVSWMERLRAARRSIRVGIVELNLFKTADMRTDPFKLKTSIISTRVYLLLLFLSMTIIAIYTLSLLRIQTVTVQNPSRATFERLYNEYSSTVRCPCSHIAIPYKLFTSLSPNFHPVCSSLFVSNAWIVSTSNLNNPDSLYDFSDFHVAGQTFFNTLATLCTLSQITVADTWYIFREIPLITDMTLPESEFYIRIQTALETFEKNTIAEFKRSLALIESHTRSLYATGYQCILLHTNQTVNSTTRIDFGWVPFESNTCSCGLTDECQRMMGFYNYINDTIYNPYSLNFTLPNLFVDCFVISSVYRSSLECFYNQTCLDVVQVAIRSQRSINISILQTATTQFLAQTPMGTIVDNLMVETWDKSIQYEKYYEQCVPEQCTYTFTSRGNPLEVVTTLIGLFGGLSVTLKIIAPLVVDWIRNRMRPNVEANNTIGRSSLANRVRTAWRLLRTKALELNMFESELAWDDHRHRQREIVTTRIYVLLITFAVIILIVYNSVANQVQLIKIQSPSQTTFDQLRFNPQYSPTLECPCQNITIAYSSFISIVPHYHQLCSSDFTNTNSSWIPLLYSSTAGLEYSYDDFRLFAVPQFRLLVALCTLANETLSEEVVLFTTSTIISERVQFRETIESEANTILNQFRLSIPRTFVRTLDFIRNMAQGNGIVSSVLSNWHFRSLNTYGDWPALWAESRSYGDNNCSCGTNAMCTSQAAFNGSVVPGFRVGCYPLEALLQSTLECLYNASCIDLLKFMYHHSNLTINPLDSTLSSPKATVQSLIDALLVDRWETSVAYEQYYAACGPLLCTYTLNERVSLVYIVTSIIGLYGGLTVVLKLVVPISVKIAQYLIMCHRQRVEPTVTVIAASN